MLRALLLVFVVIHAPLAGAQDATLAGRVIRAGSTTPIAGADVRIAPGARRFITDSSGEFRFDAVAAGRVAIHVRRLGFLPESLAVDLPSPVALTIELHEAAQPLDTVSVIGRDDLLARGKLAGFYERKRFGIGRFLEAKDIETMLYRQMADVLVSRFPGIRAIRISGRPGAFMATSRLSPRALVSGPPQPCYAEVYLDGMVVSAHGPATAPFDVNTINPSEVSAIEFYAGPSQTPAEYNMTGSACGVLLIWTK